MRPNYRQNAQWTFRNRSQIGIEMKIIIMTIIEVGVEIETIVDLSQGEEKSLSPNLTPGLVLIMIKSGVINVGNTIISCPNALIPQLTRRLIMKTEIQPLYK